MQYTTARTGKVLILRLEDGDPVYESIEKTAETEGISSGIVWCIGGVKNGKVVVGPKNDTAIPIEPMLETFTDAREIIGFGTLFKNSAGKVSLHLHAGIGKDTKTIVGCPRKGLDCWLITEVIIMELTDAAAKRVKNQSSGFELLEVNR